MIQFLEVDYILSTNENIFLHETLQNTILQDEISASLSKMSILLISYRISIIPPMSYYSTRRNANAYAKM